MSQSTINNTTPDNTDESGNTDSQWVSLNSRLKKRPRGQLHTLEALIGSLLILSVIIFAVQATALSPLITESTDDQIQTEQQKISTGVLEHANTAPASDPNSRLTEAEHMTLYWNQSQQTFHGTSGSVYDGVYPATEFGSTLETAFQNESLVANVHLSFQETGGGVSTRSIVEMGEPSETAVTASETVVLYDDDELTGPGTVSTSVSEADEFYAPDAHPSTRVYNVVEIRVEVWKL